MVVQVVKKQMVSSYPLLITFEDETKEEDNLDVI